MCVQSPENLLQTITKFQYDRGTFIDAIISQWIYVIGGAVAIVVLIIMFIIFYKCNFFQTVRFYKKQLEDAKRQNLELHGRKINRRNKKEVKGKTN